METSWLFPAACALALPRGDHPSAAHPVPGGLVMVYTGMENTTIRRFRTTLPAR